jgi:hypothetical protein
MLEQAAQVAVEAGSRLPLIETGVIALSLKAAVDIGREVLRWRQAKARAKEAAARAKEVEAKADLEEAKAYGISLIKSKNGVPDKQTLVAFCPAHIDIIDKMARQEEQTKFINEKLGDIKTTVDAIRTAVGK